ncbi:MAG: hypothetical protein SOX31_05310 [Eubacteriales bacterium]|nr:hypothetical protein [Eubacteriales bacterium]
MIPISVGFFLDIALICVVLLVVYVCARRGFVRLLLSGVSVLVALAVAFAGTAALARPIAGAASGAMERFLVHQTSRFLPDEDALDTIVSMSDKVVTVVRAVLEKMDRGSDDAEEAAAETAADETQDAESEPLRELAYGISLALYGFLLFAVLFSLILAILRVLIDRLAFIERIPIVGALDLSLGLILGLAAGVVVLFLPVIVMETLIPRVLGSGFAVPAEVFSGSWLMRMTYALYPFK